MQARRLNNVVFDLGGVLVDWNPRYMYRELFEGDEAKVEWFLANVCTQDWNEGQDAGRPFAEGVRLLVRRFPEYETHIRAYHERWEDMLGGVIDASAQILAELKAKKVPLFALTNWSHETFPIARRKFSFLEHFDGIVVSGEIRKIKPDPAIFHHLMETHRISPGDSVFIDDSRPNVEAARRLGFHGLHFREPHQIRDELVKLGFL